MSQSDQQIDRRENSGPGSAAGAAIGPKDWLFAAVLVVVVFLVYQPAWHGGFLWDDDTHLLNNPVLKPGGLAKIWMPGGYINYWPLTFTVYWLEFHLWGLQPLGYHLVNLALHALSALLLWQVLVRLRVPGAMFAAAIFALHPVNVESVAWIAQLKGILSLALALASVLFYLDHERRGGRWRYVLAIAAFALSALAKGTALTLPIVLLALAWWQRGRITRRDLLRVVPYALVGAVMAGVEVWGQHLVTGEAVRSDGLLSRAAVAGCAVWFYLGKLIWPLDLCFFYPRWTIDDRSVLSYLPGIALVALLALAWWRRRTWGRPVVMLVVCYAALLLPVLGFVNIYAMRFSLAADHWQYAASVVPCAIFAGASATVARRTRFHPRTNFLLSLWVVLTLAGLTWRQCRMYADADTLYQTTISRNPACWLAHNNLGMDLLSRGQFDEAVSHFKTALEIKPDFEEAHYNLANALAGRGDVDEAIAHYRKALEIEPDYAIAHNNLGAILFARGRVDEAVAHYTKALAAMPNNAEAHNNVGIVLAGRGYLDEAIGHYQKALEINPNFAAAEYDLALALAAAGRLDEAIARYQRALEIKPDYVGARLNLAAARRKRETILTAINERREAMRSRPNDAALFNDTAWTLATNPNESIRNGAEAVRMAERALHLTGDRDPAVLDTLAAAYAEAGRFSEAIETADHARVLASNQRNTSLVEKITERLRLYRAHTAFRDQR